MKKEQIMMDHGSGGKLSHRLITQILLPAFENELLGQMNDGAVFAVENGRLAFSTDSYVVDPIFFPGGSIGDLAINGTVNDLAMCGAVPLYLSVGLIIEEGFAVADLQRILEDMAAAARKAAVTVVTGDTKVVPKGAADKIFINTSGVGRVADPVSVGGDRARPGDRVLVSGAIADHGMTIIRQREGLDFDAPIQSDTTCLNHLVQQMLAICPDIRVLRDPTRGGVATSLNEIAQQSNVGMVIDERRIPVRPEVAGICELLGFDPLYVANEGRLLAVVPAAATEPLLETMRKNEEATDACCIGEVVEAHPGKVFMRTDIGGTRIVDMLTGEQLPRIC